MPKAQTFEVQVTETRPVTMVKTFLIQAVSEKEARRLTVFKMAQEWELLEDQHAFMVGPKIVSAEVL